MSDRHASLPDFDGTALPHGNGRSYGDSCLNPDGALLRTRGMDRFIAFDAATGVLRCEAGVQLAEIIALALPQGWFLPVSPGTRFVTVGGAIANDVHGKNHHAAGSFGEHVRAFELLRSDGQRLLCTRAHNADWFAATVGGLGLTGLVTWAEIALRRVPGRGKDSQPTGARSPNCLSTARKEPEPRRRMRPSSSAVASGAAAGGSTHWYCRKPRGPYMRFQLVIASSG
jgi:hypothetical protein